MNKKQFFQACIFLAIVFLLLLCSTYIVRTNGEVKDRFAGFYAEPDNTIDMVYIGASPIGASFSPGLLWGNTGITSYPLSSNSQPTKAIEYLIKEAYSSQNPQLFVIEVRMFTQDADTQAEDTAHIREVTDNMKQSVNRISAINAMVEDKSERYTYYFDIIKFHSNWKMFTDVNELKKFNNTLKNTDKGLVASSEYMTLPSYPMDLDKDYTTEIPKQQEEILRNLLTYLQTNNIPALFVATPQYARQEYMGQMNYIADITSEYGYNFYDMYKWPMDYGFDVNRDLRDGSHTNTIGAYKCTVALGEYIEENYNIDTSITKENTEDWQEAYDSYVSSYEDAVKNPVCVE